MRDNEAELTEKLNTLLHVPYPPSSLYSHLKSQARKQGDRLLFSRKEFNEWWVGEKDACYYCGVSPRTQTKLVGLLSDYHGSNPVVVSLLGALPESSVEECWHLFARKISFFEPYTLTNICKMCWFCTMLRGRFIPAEAMQTVGKAFLAKLLNAIQESR